MPYILASVAAWAGEPADTTDLPEVNVTAIKGGSTSLHLEPMAVTVVGNAEVERLNILTMRDVSEISPNFYIPEYGSRMTSSIYMRGIGARIDQPVVGLNVDNVPILNKDNYDFDLVDIERIEVMRGPQSTLYGRNTMGGQINIVTLSPMRFQGFRAMLEGGTHTSLRAAMACYHRFNHNIGSAVSIQYNHTNGYHTNTYDGSHTGLENSGSIRWKTVWSPAPAWVIENTASGAMSRQEGYPYESVATGVISYNDPCFYRRGSFADGLTLKYSGRNFTLSSITSVQYLDDNMTLDQDFLPQSYFTLSQIRRETTLTQDIIVRGSAGNYSWLGGTFLFYKRQHMQAPVTFKEYGIEQLIENKRNEINPHYPIRWEDDTFVLNSDFTNPVWGAALYHRSTFTTGRWKLEGSLRLDYEQNSLNYHSFCSTAYDVVEASTGELYSHEPVNIDDDGKLHCSFTRLLPKVAVSYRLPMDDASIVYASVARGYKAGGYNTQMFSDVLQQRIMGLMGLSMKYDVDEIISYKPEQSWNYEAGASLTLMDRRLSAQAAIFYIDCRDQQLTMFPEGSTTGRIMANAGKTRSWGVELAATFSPDSRWLLNASWGFTDARFVDFSDGRINYKGKRVPYAPRNTIFWGTTYTLPLDSRHTSSLEFDMNVRAIGSIYWDEANTVKQPLYALLGASATWTRGNFSVKVWADNITATHYATFYFMSIGNTFLQQGAPTTAGVTLRLALDTL